MKRYSFLIFVAAILFSCKNETSETTNTAGAADSLSKKDSTEQYVDMYDSVIFHIGNHEFEVGASDERDFNAVPDPFKMKDTSEASRIKKAATAVSRSGDSLIFTCANNEMAYLVDNKTEDDVDNYAGYTFIQDMPQINQWLVMGEYYESYNYIFIDKTSGDTTFLYGMPVVSPDNKYIITFNQDIEAGFTFNGFQLLEMKDSKLTVLGEKPLYNWGPDNVRWKNATTLLVQKSQLKSDPAHPEQGMVTEYVQIKMK